MREILFRGKRIDNGEWVKGCLICRPRQQDRCFIIDEVNTTALRGCATGQADKYDWRSVEVIPSTVGQSTGLTDKNGKKIFEGDILDCITSDYDGSDKLVCGFRITDTTDFQQKGFLGCCHEIEVIGNIFDNPELIGGEQK